MKTSQTPLNTPQPDTKDVQYALDRQKAYTRKLHGEVQGATNHHPSCTSIEKELVWHCHQCGINEPAGEFNSNGIEAALDDLSESLIASLWAGKGILNETRVRDILTRLVMGERDRYKDLVERDNEPASNKAQHSPLPWHDDEDDQGEIYDNTECCIADNLHPDNARLIVHTVNHASKLAEALRELSDAIEEQGSLEVDKHGNPVSQNAAGRNYERRCVARSKAIKTLAAYEAAQ